MKVGSNPKRSIRSPEQVRNPKRVAPSPYGHRLLHSALAQRVQARLGRQPTRPSATIRSAILAAPSHPLTFLAFLHLVGMSITTKLLAWDLRTAQQCVMSLGLKWMWQPHCLARGDWQERPTDLDRQLLVLFHALYSKHPQQ